MIESEVEMFIDSKYDISIAKRNDNILTPAPNMPHLGQSMKHLQKKNIID